MINWLLDGSNWVGMDGVASLIVQHLIYTGLALFAACCIGIPIGLYVGHTQRGIVVIAGFSNVMRALPSLGLVVLLVIVFGQVFTSDLAFEIPSLIVLSVLVLPPIVTSTYAGILAVDAAVVDAARGMGYRPMRLLFGVEVPCALPMIISGLRSATLQTVSTATIAAYVSLGGLGRLIIDGRAQNDYGQMAAGALLVGLLALALDLVFVTLSQFAVSPGISRRI
ncbi:ABC transporter permease [Burkholderia diffusa]|uniref:ABC transporter permease n=1 Tax=Burkholderia diffusa TaxID=488732 RepID=UPI00157A4D29|nr:ABC transporter permease subunit [Burkholderia diffusa]